jgi:hypothetical protein
MNAESSQMTTASVHKKRKGLANAAAGSSTSVVEERKRVPGLRGRRKLGLLANLPSMPLDILFEVNLNILLLHSIILHLLDPRSFETLRRFKARTDHQRLPKSSLEQVIFVNMESCS